MDLQSGTSPGSVLSVSTLSTPSATDLAVLGSWKYRLVVLSSRPVILLWMSVCPDWPNHQVIRVSHFRNFNLYIEEKEGLENKSRHSYNTDKGFMPSSYILILVIWNVTPIVRNGTEYVVKSGVLRWATDTTAYTLREQGKGRSDTLQRKGRWHHRWEILLMWSNARECWLLSEAYQDKDRSSWALPKPFSTSETEFPAHTVSGYISGEFSHQTVVRHKQTKQRPIPEMFLSSLLSFLSRCIFKTPSYPL